MLWTVSPPPSPEAPECKFPSIYQLPQRPLYFLHTNLCVLKFNLQPLEIRPLRFLSAPGLDGLDDSFRLFSPLSSPREPYPCEFLSLPDQLAGEPEEDEDDDLQDQALAAAGYDDAVCGKGVPVFFHVQDGVSSECGGGGKFDVGSKRRLMEVMWVSFKGICSLLSEEDFRRGEAI
ncbi:hypothetical protein SAY87_024929 [Trapa incisa]|uniref:Uncharacterized protein n=1 Tax=Trapa incisa TaxID=236973 RepID=A0AAN7GAF2_9MYRT|nr:hypothetical protein SAY87_024929 [Trapa incisa]